jgi:pyrroline-5-carboxylate reductase
MKIGIIGMGKMALALARSWVKVGLLPPENLTASSTAEGASRQRYLDSFPPGTARWTEDNAVAARAGDLVLLAVKPQKAGVILPGLREATGGKLVISVMTGISTDALERGLHPTARVVRTMPNTPMLVGAGASAYCLGRRATADDEGEARRLLEAGGACWRVEESQMDAVTGTSGSGPAYVFHFVEALEAGGIAQGLAPELARTLAIQTVFGAARLLQETGQAPLDLATQVKSPGGTTMAACAVLEARGFREAIVEAVSAATRRANELARSAEDTFPRG